MTDLTLFRQYYLSLITRPSSSKSTLIEVQYTIDFIRVDTTTAKSP